jgi:glycosyltransferase involved in cell wall biosynthesis
LPEKATLFGFFFDARSSIERKNPADLLRAFRRAFRRDDQVALVLKVSHSDGAPAAMRELSALAEGLPVVWIRDVNLDERQTQTLLGRLDVYASLHRAEGFGLVLAEAMALGKPVVATGFSGNLEFMDDRSSRLVRAKEVVTDRAHGPYPRGTRWAAPDVEHAAELLRSLAADRELRQDIGRQARRRVEQTLAPQVVARTLVQHLGLASASRMSRILPPPSDVGPVRARDGESEGANGRTAEPGLS